MFEDTIRALVELKGKTIEHVEIRVEKIDGYPYQSVKISTTDGETVTIGFDPYDDDVDYNFRVIKAKKE